jgi:hypothetical protein
MLHAAMKIAHELGISLSAFMALPVSEFFQWRAYFSLTPEDLVRPVPVDDQLRAAFSKIKENHG